MQKHLIAAAVLGLVSVQPGHSATFTDATFVSSTVQNAQTGLTYDGLMQTFTVENDGMIEGVDLLLQRGLGTTEGLIVEIWDTDTGAPTSVLGGTGLDANQVSGNRFDWTYALLSISGINVTAGQVLGVSISSAGVYRWNAGEGGAATYTGGQRFSDVGTGWYAVPTWDFSFRVELSGDAPAIPLPAGLPLILSGMGVFGALRLRRRA